MSPVGHIFVNFLYYCGDFLGKAFGVQKTQRIDNLADSEDNKFEGIKEYN